MITFKYNNKIWKPKNPEKKLRQLGITWADVEIIKEEVLVLEDEIDTSIKKYYFKNTITEEKITSIYQNKKKKKNIVNIYEYKRQSN